MKMSLGRCCILLYDSSGEPVVGLEERGFPRKNVSGSNFGVGAPISGEELEKKKTKKRSIKSPRTAVLQSWLFSILLCRFYTR